MKKIWDKLETIYYRIRYFIVYKLWYNIRMSFLSIGKPYRIDELWCLFIPFAEFMLPRVKAFRHMKRMGIPCEFVDELKEDWKGEYKEAEEKWNAILDEVIFALEYILYSDMMLSKKEAKEFERKYGDVWAKIEKNKHEPLEITILEEDGTERKSKMFDGKPFYHDRELEAQFEKRRDEGLKLFSEYIMAMWD